MRYFVSALVFSLLFIVPAGSWYYLQSGLNYRKAALKELEPKMKFESSIIGDEKIKSKTTLLQLKSVDSEVMPRVFDQYGKSQTYQMFSLDTPTELAPNWKQIPVTQAGIISNQFDGAGFVLVDTSMMVRNTYAADMEGVRKMIEHTSIILPRVREIDIKMKRNGGK